MKRQSDMDAISEFPSAEHVRSVLRYFPDNDLEWFCWDTDHKADVPNDSRVKDGYLEIRISGTFYRADCLAWLMMEGHWPHRGTVDHLDGDRLNCKFSNLIDGDDLFVGPDR